MIQIQKLEKCSYEVNFEIYLEDDNEPVLLSDTENMDQDYIEENSKDGDTSENTVSEVQKRETNSKNFKEKAPKPIIVFDITGTTRSLKCN